MKTGRASSSAVVARVDQHVGLAADPHRASRSRSDGSNSTATGKRCDWRSQSRLFSISAACRPAAACPADAAADAAHAALQDLARHHVEHDGDPVARLDVAEVVLGEVGADPQVVDRDQRHHRGPGCANCPTSVRRSVTRRRAGGDDQGAPEVELGLLDRRAGADQLRVLVAAFAGDLDGPLQVRLRGRFLACAP
jgi:hypothetical protein